MEKVSAGSEEFGVFGDAFDRHMARSADDGTSMDWDEIGSQLQAVADDVLNGGVTPAQFSFMLSLAAPAEDG